MFGSHHSQQMPDRSLATVVLNRLQYNILMQHTCDQEMNCRIVSCHTRAYNLLLFLSLQVHGAR